MKIYDLTAPIHQSLVLYPGDPGLRITRVSEISRGDSANVSQIQMGSHTGTHLDSPLHFIPGGNAIDQIPLERLVGPARVVEIPGVRSIGPDLLEPLHLQPGERVLLKTENSFVNLMDQPEFTTEYTSLSPEGAQYLVEREIGLLGIDYLSVEAKGSPGHSVHMNLLGAGILVIEGLRMAQIQPGRYELICLPLLIQGGDGAPARVILREG